MIGLAPGVVVGTSIVYLVSSSWIKLVTFAVLTPLILLQAAGIRRPLKSERSAALALGGGVGVLYSMTTISGPPLALMFNNQGYVKNDFRAALALVRLAESSMTAVAYFYVGMFTVESVGLVPLIVPSVLVGIPIGVYVIRHVRTETFRRLCMSFDAWIVGFGMSKVLSELHIAEGAGLLFSGRCWLHRSMAALSVLHQTRCGGDTELVAAAASLDIGLCRGHHTPLESRFRFHVVGSACASPTEPTNTS